jgi:hypothetical protein
MFSSKGFLFRKVEAGGGWLTHFSRVPQLAYLKGACDDFS